MTVKDRRREVRISASDDDLLAEAAGLAGVSVSEFLLARLSPTRSRSLKRTARSASRARAWTLS